MKVIVDTCVWSLFFRGAHDSADPVLVEIRSLIRSKSIQMLGCIRQELLSGVQPDERFERLRDYLRFFPNLPVDEQDDESAAACYNVCRRNGIQGGLFDLLICALAIRYRMPIFTTDTDFALFANHLPIDLHSPRYSR